jgi:hypothetical protein
VFQLISEKGDSGYDSNVKITAAARERNADEQKKKQIKFKLQEEKMKETFAKSSNSNRRPKWKSCPLVSKV